MSSEMRNGDWMQTAHGRKFWPLDPRSEEVFLDDIAHALSNMCRFAGHCRVFYSVAEHSVRVSTLAVGDELALAALLHDAAEAYVVDVPRPLKPYLEGYKSIEARVAGCIERRFNLTCGILDNEAVKRWDGILLATEARDLMGGECAGKWGAAQMAPATALPDRIEPWTPERARQEFLRRFHALTGGAGG